MSFRQARNSANVSYPSDGFLEATTERLAFHDVLGDVARRKNPTIKLSGRR